MDIHPDHTTTISEYYKGKHIFITGATGFLGKVLIDKLLRGCPDIGNIYILVRPKKGKDVKQRLEHTLNDLLFDTLKQTNASQLSKLIPLKGDCAELNLGLSEGDYETITSCVSVIYHVAASVRFDGPLKHAILLNTRGTRELARLALRTHDLAVLVHVSTAYCNCVFGEDIKEQMYPAPDDWKKAIKIAEEFDSNQLALLTDKYIGPYPNTYTFTKALAEHVVKDLCEGKVPTVICRPSIVFSTIKDPVVGWIDNFNGPVGLIVAGGKGLFRLGYVHPDVKIDYIPCDVLIKAIIVASWDLGLRQPRVIRLQGRGPLVRGFVNHPRAINIKQREQVEKIHCTCGYNKWMTYGTFLSTAKELSYEIPLNNSVWAPKGGVTRCVYYFYLCTILFHLVPACFLDLGLKLAGKKPILMKLQTKIFNISLQLRTVIDKNCFKEKQKIFKIFQKYIGYSIKKYKVSYHCAKMQHPVEKLILQIDGPPGIDILLILRYFTWQSWDFCNKNMIAIQKKILEEDKETWGYDCRIENVMEYMRGFMLGLRRYLLHEPDETLPSAKVHQIRLYWLDKLTMFILYGSLFWFILYLGLMEKVVSAIYNSVTY